jgi:hypothetical protein
MKTLGRLKSEHSAVRTLVFNPPSFAALTMFAKPVAQLVAKFDAACAWLIALWASLLSLLYSLGVFGPSRIVSFTAGFDLTTLTSRSPSG